MAFALGTDVAARLDREEPISMSAALPQTAHEAMLSARRYAGRDAASARIVDQAVAEDAVRATALELASAQVIKAGDALGTIKARMYAPVLTALRDTTITLG
ncbi:MAG: hypothetical protein JOZ23_01850 [Mycobacterium sp.]|nr:hypothetical protein [Mycobacterium sp.]